MKTCPKCGYTTNRNVNFCFRDGSQLDIQKVYCLHCGRMLSPEDNFCENCGTEKPKTNNVRIIGNTLD